MAEQARPGPRAFAGIGCLAALGAALLTGGLGFLLGREPLFESPRVRAERKALGAQRARLNGEFRRLEDERRRLRDERAALRYRDLDEEWIVRGWWEVAPKGEVTTDAMTRQREIHLYAENQGVGRTWDGTGTAGALAVTITDSRFDQLESEPFGYEGPRSVSFYRRKAPEGLADHVEVFECPAEAPPDAGAPPPSKGEGQGEAGGRSPRPRRDASPGGGPAQGRSAPVR